MNTAQIAAARRALQRLRAGAKHLPSSRRKMARSVIADVEAMLQLAETAAARVCSKCGHPEPGRGRGWCEQWIELGGTDAQLACCDSNCSYDMPA
jgi:hypothetical protein